MNSIDAVHAVVKCGITVYVSISFFFYPLLSDIWNLLCGSDYRVL